MGCRGLLLASWMINLIMALRPLSIEANVLANLSMMENFWLILSSAKPLWLPLILAPNRVKINSE